ncbi:hypothetical protein B0181_07890 [Moraxella caviae]|uniref:Uncharacterized protein n=1 Tax=Moraxella caviae TaxID=34060 RepID=A0A1S9ZYY5_9GAMM|nr:hypothetical protein [Moraxella caviae]OOR88628.1 hypothetical protein B0181_07890 [Moraxella caviae]STZ13689.1 Uncharacterised protein [Moraxella caviae]
MANISTAYGTVTVKCKDRKGLALLNKAVQFIHNDTVAGNYGFMITHIDPANVIQLEDGESYHFTGVGRWEFSNVMKYWLDWLDEDLQAKLKTFDWELQFEYTDWEPGNLQLVQELFICGSYEEDYSRVVYAQLVEGENLPYTAENLNKHGFVDYAMDGSPAFYNDIAELAQDVFDVDEVDGGKLVQDYPQIFENQCYHDYEELMCALEDIKDDYLSKME